MIALDYMVLYFQVFLLIWVRLAGICLVAPVLSSAQIPVRLRLSLALILALMILPWAYQFKQDIPPSMGFYILAILNEVLIGVIIGFMVTLVFGALRLSTQFFSIQMGLAMSQVFDPETQEQTPIMSYLFYMTAILVFLRIDGLQMTIRAVTESYRTVPLINVMGSHELIYNIILKHFIIMFKIALKLALPVICAGLIVVVTLGLIGKAAPQANILILGLPIQFASGFIFILVLLPFIVEIFNSSIANVWRELNILFMRLGRPV